jgi:hypothetical protein
MGARHIGVTQSPLATRRLHAIDRYDCLVDVPRVGRHPASRGAELTPRLLKECFVAKPAFDWA